jgi:hypothetical protein
MGDEKRQLAACAPRGNNLGEGDGDLQLERAQHADPPAPQRRATARRWSTNCTTSASPIRGGELAAVEGLAAPQKAPEAGGLDAGACQEVCVIADYLGKPRKSPKYFESEVSVSVGKSGPAPGRVFNARMLDSCSSLSIQVVDLLLGGVRHAFLASREPGVPWAASKDAITVRIKQHVGVPTLAAGFTGRPQQV